MSKPWEVLESEILLDRRYLKVRTQKVRLDSGVVIDDYHVIECPPWVAVVCVTDDRELVLVSQYRHAHQGTSLELPAGMIEPGEDVVVAAARELREETGYECSNVTELWKIRPEPARHDQWAHFCFARGARRVTSQDLEPTESIQVVKRPLSELDSIIHEMVHAPHVAALLLAERRGLLR